MDGQTDNGFWITETTTWKIYAKTEAEAAEIWDQYVNGKSWKDLPMSMKDGDVEADWTWEKETET